MPTYDYGPYPSPELLDKVYDYCIIGSGAAGTVAARELTEQGFNVLMLERGPYPNHTLTYDDVLRAAEAAYARTDNGAWSLQGYPWTTCNVGGGTVFYGGVSFRYREIDFDTTSFLAETGLSMQWPYTYQEISPFYTEIENLLGISGDPTLDPYSPKDHVSLPNPPIELSVQAQLLQQAGHRLGLQPFPTPLAILSRPRNGRGPCSFSSSCIEHHCETGAKSDALNLLQTVFNKENFQLCAGIQALTLNRKQEHTVVSITGKHVVDSTLFNFQARNFIVACNAIQSARLLLSSKDRWGKQGIGNNYDQVGRTFCQKLSGYVTGYYPVAASVGKDHPYLNNHGPFSTLSFTDYYQSAEFPFGLGGLIYEAKYGFPYVACKQGVVIRLECLLADIPALRNRIQIDPTDDKVIMDYLPHPLDLVRLNMLMGKAIEILKSMGCTDIVTENSGFGLGSCHLHGTCRYGRSEKEGVLDANSKVYGVDNLYVIDGSFMPYPGGVNPTLTIQAHALKTARSLAKAT